MPASSSVMWPTPVSRCWTAKAHRQRETCPGTSWGWGQWNLETGGMREHPWHPHAVLGRVEQDSGAAGGDGQACGPTTQQAAPALHSSREALSQAPYPGPHHSKPSFLLAGLDEEAFFFPNGGETRAKGLHNKSKDEF